MAQRRDDKNAAVRHGERLSLLPNENGLTEEYYFSDVDYSKATKTVLELRDA